MSGARGADVELIEYSDHPESIGIVKPNAVLINGQETWLSADHPVTVEYDAQPPLSDGIPDEIVTVTLTLQCRSLKIEARAREERE